MNETQEIQATEAHYGLLVDIDAGKVADRLGALGEMPYRIADGEPVNVSKLTWDAEALGWVWRAVQDPTWRLTDAGRQAMEGSGL